MCIVPVSFVTNTLLRSSSAATCGTLVSPYSGIASPGACRAKLSPSAASSFTPTRKSTAFFRSTSSRASSAKRASDHRLLLSLAPN